MSASWPVESRHWAAGSCDEPAPARPLDAAENAALPLYAYAVGCPLRLLSPRGAWEEGIIVDRAAHSNQFVVRMPPVGHRHWTLLLPWDPFESPRP